MSEGFKPIVQSRALPAVLRKAQAFLQDIQYCRVSLEEIRQTGLTITARETLYAQLAAVAFSYWAKKLNHPAALFDDKRRRRIMTRLRESRGDLNAMLYAVDGALRDDYLMGRATNSPRKYDGIETIFRDRAQVERLAELCPKFQNGEPHPLLAKYAPNGNGHA